MANKNRMPGCAEPDLNRARDLVMELMAIPGKSGEEALAADFVRRQLLRAGAESSQIRLDSAHNRSPLGGHCGNLFLTLPGTKPGTRRLLSSHLDTVPLCVGSSPRQTGQLIRSANPGTALGADDRAGVAVTLCAALEILHHRLAHPPLTFCWFVQEEVGLFGSRHVNRRILGKPKLAFNWDGGCAAKMTIGATGAYRLSIEVQGIASHAGVAPEMGVSAIAVAALAIADLQRGGWHGAVSKNGKRGTSNVGFVQGGGATNVVADRVVVKAEARSHHAGFRLAIRDQIQKAFQSAAKNVSSASGATAKVSITSSLDYDSFKLPRRDASVRAGAQAIQSIGRSPLYAIADGGVDANWLYKHGIFSVTLGCGQLNPHTTNEQLDLDEFSDACRIALRLACGIA